MSHPQEAFCQQRIQELSFEDIFKTYIKTLTPPTVLQWCASLMLSPTSKMSAGLFFFFLSFSEV